MIISDIGLGTHPVAPASYSGTYAPSPQQLFGLGGDVDVKTIAGNAAMGVALLSAGIYSLAGIRKGKKNTMNNVLLGGLGLGLGTVGGIKLWDSFKPTA